MINEIDVSRLNELLSIRFKTAREYKKALHETRKALRELNKLETHLTIEIDKLPL